MVARVNGASRARAANSSGSYAKQYAALTPKQKARVDFSFSYQSYRAGPEWGRTVAGRQTAGYTIRNQRRPPKGRALKEPRKHSANKFYTKHPSLVAPSGSLAAVAGLSLAGPALSLTSKQGRYILKSQGIAATRMAKQSARAKKVRTKAWGRHYAGVAREAPSAFAGGYKRGAARGRASRAAAKHGRVYVGSTVGPMTRHRRPAGMIGTGQRRDGRGRFA